MTSATVALCELAGRHFPAVEEEVSRQYPDYLLHVDEPWPQDTYARFIESQWMIPGDLVICEGDVLPAPGSIEDLLTCERDWCLFPLWLADHYADITLGLCKFSDRLKARMPFIPGRSWFGHEGTRKVYNWKAIDIAMAYELIKNKAEPHLHQPPPIHLRYDNDPRARPLA